MHWFIKYQIPKPSFATVFILIAATLYIYATSLKQMAVVVQYNSCPNALSVIIIEF
jgi:hypothetical protein